MDYNATYIYYYCIFILSLNAMLSLHYVIYLRAVMNLHSLLSSHTSLCLHASHAAIAVSFIAAFVAPAVLLLPRSYDLSLMVLYALLVLAVRSSHEAPH